MNELVEAKLTTAFGTVVTLTHNKNGKTGVYAKFPTGKTDYQEFECNISAMLAAMEKHGYRLEETKREIAKCKQVGVAFEYEVTKFKNGKVVA
jgi:hypothetical protein